MTVVIIFGEALNEQPQAKRVQLLKEKNTQFCILKKFLLTHSIREYTIKWSDSCVFNVLRGMFHVTAKRKIQLSRKNIYGSCLQNNF